jgi:hypothetical protein
LAAGQDLIRAPRFVTGYHGCAADTAELLLRGEPWLPSENQYDWLGSGVYFWEYGPFRAREWAEQRFGRDAVVLEARIRLGRCLNLLDTEHFAKLRSALNALMVSAEQDGVPLPGNRPGGSHRLDRLLIETYVQALQAEGEATVQTVRGCFPEGAPVYPGSQILARTHVQIAVRDPACIGRLRLVE